MQVLQDFVARQYLAQLPLSKTQKKLADDIVGLLDSEGRVSIANLKKTLFPYDELDAVNTRLRRLRKEIERLSGETQVSFALRVTDAKKVGPEARFLWFEGVNNWSPAVSTPELDAIPTSGEYVSKANESGSTPIALLLTFNEHEAHQLWAEFGGVRNELPREGVTYYELDGVGGFRVIHRHSRQGPQEAQLSATQAIDHWNPQLLIAVGIAFGVNEKKQHLRDVLVSEKVLDYELARVEPDGTFTYRGTPQETSRELAERVANINLQRRGNAGWPTIRMGIMLSGAKLVDNEEYRNTIASLHSKVIGGEMEGSGILTACSRDGVDMIVVKAICDWASHKDTPSKEEDQKKAAQSAAIVARAILEKGHLTGTIPTLKQENLALKKQLDELKNPQHRAPRFPDVLGMGKHDEVLEEKHLIRDSRASSVNLDPNAAPGIPAQGTPVVDAMLDWVANPTEPQLFALLGEYGMGKTVNCQRFTRQLAERRKANPTLPMPLYFNLKNVADARLADNLEDLVVTCMRDDWLPKHSPQHTWQAFTSWIATGPCVVIFDGLDEMLVKLDDSQGSLFLNRLLGTLQLLDDEDSNRRIRLVLSCRTQYFRTLLDQRSFFLGKDRQDLRADSYRAMTLLPLGDEQIRRYLETALPGSDIARIMELVASVHNLPELAARPFSLKLIAEHIPEIERNRASGKPVFGATLYKAMVERWLARDEGKHFIDPKHKSAFMAELSAWLWREKKTTAPLEDVENLFQDWTFANKRLRRYSAGLPSSDWDKLDEDLRTATFLARQDDKRGSAFRFAHTSLQEYFLARYLLDAIQRDDRSRWAMRIPSAETLDFLGQLLSEAQDPELIDTLSSWKTPYQEQASELLLRYTFAARKRKYPAPNLARIDLSGAHLDDWDFLGTSNDPLNLAEANFTNASLRRTAFSNTNLTGAQFSKSVLNQATFHSCTTRNTEWHDAPHPGAAWQTPILSIPAGMKTALYPGHTGAVTGVAWHPGGDFIATTSWDCTCIIWNPNTAEKITTLTGHTSWVSGVAWHPSGDLIATTSNDGTCIIWNPNTSEKITTLTGHTHEITGVAWHPSGDLIATTSEDDCIIWDPHTKKKITTLTGHTSWVSGVAWHPTEDLIATTSWDGTCIIWNPHTGEKIITFITGHTDEVTNVAWHPSGGLLATTSDDRTCIIQNPHTGETITTLTGHTDWAAGVAWHPTEDLIATTSNDHSRMIYSEITAANRNIGSCIIWDPHTGEKITTLTSHAGRLGDVVWHPSGDLIATTSWDGTCIIWDPHTGKKITTLTGHTNWAAGVAWHPTGNLIATTSEDDCIIWDPHTGKKITTLTGHTSRVNTVAWHHSGDLIATTDTLGLIRISHLDGTLERAFISVRPRVPGVESYASWTPQGLDVLEGEAWRVLRVPEPDGGSRRLEIPGLSYEPPTD